MLDPLDRQTPAQVSTLTLAVEMAEAAIVAAVVAAAGAYGIVALLGGDWRHTFVLAFVACYGGAAIRLLREEFRSSGLTP